MGGRGPLVGRVTLDFSIHVLIWQQIDGKSFALDFKVFNAIFMYTVKTHN